ncbi:MAG: glycosyltransferase [Chitinivibrionales bacterium]|nr:glycosyltransferase [Chitinivibrionales bacterium]MBD3396791.1 glycosyltransferase [Chitinivibrionales bacterium]
MISRSRAGMSRPRDEMPAADRPRLDDPVSILMPVCNERDTIEEVVREWIDEVVRFLPEGSEFRFDDASTDGTREVLETLAREYPFVKVYHQDHKDGFGAATMRLYNAATCPLVFFTDSDGQYVPGEFWKLVPHVPMADIVHGTKTNRQDPFHRLAASRTFNFIAHRLLTVPFGDINSAFRIVKREALAAILPHIRHMPTLVNTEMLVRAAMAGMRIVEVPVRHRRRAHGRSKGLPLGSFLRECRLAYRGLLAMRKEFAADAGRLPADT